MKFSRFFAAALIAGFFFSSNANATTISIDGGAALDPGKSGSFSEGSDSGISFGEYVVSGALKAGTEISITFKATKVVLGSLLSGSGVAAQPNQVTLPQLTLPTLSVATGWAGGEMTKTIIIADKNAYAENFKAYFLDAILGRKGGLVTISYLTSAVPLPPAFILFASALAFAGFVARKKANA